MLTGPRAWVGGLAILASIGAIGYVDLSTGRPYNFSIFYVLPTAAAGWYLGRGFGVAAGILSGLSWDVSDYVIRTSDPAASIWNGLTRVAVFGALAALTDKLRYLLESMRRSQAELQGLLAQRDEFLSLMAHELRAPVAAIETVATGLAKAPALAARERHALGQLLRQARDLSALAEGVLAASQLEAGAMQLEPETFGLSELVREIAEPHPRVRLRAPSAPVLVSADRDAIRQAIANLVSNALKFSGPDRPVEVVVKRGGDGTFVQVVDQGIGLTAEGSSRLFRKYSRIERGERVQGVGLGLYFARLIVEAHQGSITADSPGPDQGSTFSLWLPAAAEGVAAAVAPERK